MLEEALEGYKQCLTCYSSWNSEDLNADRNVSSAGQAQKPSVGTRTPLAVRLEAMYVALWQKIYLHLAHVLRVCGRLI